MVPILNEIGIVRADAETANAWFCLPAPWLPGNGYIHTVFRPPDAELLESVPGLPLDYVALLRVMNGGMFFRIDYQGSIMVYGLRAPGPMKRTPDLSSVAPFDLRDHNTMPLSGTSVRIGSYYEDGSVVVWTQDGVCREDVDSRRRLPGSWASPIDWIRSEMQRLNRLFSADGKYLGASRDNTLPV